MMNEWDDRPPAEPAPWDIAALSGDLRAARDDWRARHRPDHRAGDNGFPSRRRLETVLFDLCGALFPQRLGPHPVPSEDEQCFVSATLDRALRGLQTEIALELGSAAPEAGTADATRIVADFARDLPAIRRRLDRDVEAAYAGDPAARSVDEVLLCYPGLLATIHHRIAHRLFGLGAPLVARIIAEIAHTQTGIDIHPGAQIGPGLFIDHGTGVVIGETAVLGRDVHLHQGVTIGGLDPDAEGRRHARIGDGTRIYPGAVLLGPIEVGAGSVIDANVVLRRDVPPDMIVQAPEPAYVAKAPA